MEKRNGLVDFHFHSRYSDGSEDITGIIKEAKTRGVTALALTDHNNGQGVAEFTAACKESGIIALEGVEIYLRFPDKDWSDAPGTCGKAPDGIILGRKMRWQYFREYQIKLMDYWAKYWVPATLDGLKSVGLEVPIMSGTEIREQLKDFGIPRVLHDVPKNSRNWPALLKIVRQKNPNAALEDIGKNPVAFANNHLYNLGMPAYALRVFPEWSVAQAADLAERMGGALFAAHPGGDRAPWSKKHLDYFFSNGGRGIEVWQYWHTLEQIEFFFQYAKRGPFRDDLLVSGGSDWHGKNDHPTLGLWDKLENQVPYWVVKNLFNYLP